MKIKLWKTVSMASGISILAVLPCVGQTSQLPASPLEGAITLSPPARKRMQQIRLSFVRPRVMAWWIDSKNQAMPSELAPDAASHSPELRLNLSLPAGIDRLVAVDTQNALLVFGTDEGFAAVRKIVAALDQPQRQITIEARLVTIQNDQMTRFLADLSTTSTQNPPTPASMSSNDVVALNDLILKQKARVESVRRLIIENGMVQPLDFGPSTHKRTYPNAGPSDMPVIRPPLGVDEHFVRPMNRAPRGLPAPAPFDELQLQLSPRIQADRSISLSVLSLKMGGVFHSSATVVSDLRGGETLAFVLPRVSPKTHTFLLLGARETTPIRFTPNAPRLPGIFPPVTP